MRKFILAGGLVIAVLAGCSYPTDLAAGSGGGEASARATAGAAQVTVNVNEKYQILEGWGTSLAWWGNVVGGWNDGQEDAVAQLIFGADGLGLNIVRYNIGGGKNPAVSDHMRVGAQMPVFKASASAAYDWSADAPQRDLLAKAKAHGANLFEAFANSPPWWMTKSGDTAGNVDGSNNLKDDSYPAFADFLTEVVKHFRDSWGISFRTVTPLNEPSSTWWKSTNNQEGSHFDRVKQNQIIKELGVSLASKGLTGTSVSAPEEYSVDDSLASFNSYDATTKGYLSQINTHQYSGTNFHGLRDAAWNGGVNPKTLWVSELGTGGTQSHSHNDITSALQLGNAIRDAVQEMGVNAWVYWQAVEDEAGNNNYGFLHANFTGSHSYWVTKQYWAMANYSKLLRPGSQSIGYSGPNTSSGIKGSGYLDSSGRVVIVLVNNAATAQLVDLNVTGRSVTTFTPYITSVSDNFRQLGPVSSAGYSVPARSIVTLVEGTWIDGNGWYKIVNRNSGKVLDVSEGSLSDGAGILQWTDTGTANQLWKWTDLGTGSFKITNQNSSKPMDISGASLADGAQNIQWSDNGGLNQQWQLVEAGSGWYKIRNRLSSKLLDISGASKTNGALSIQWTDNGGTNQQWRLVKAP